MFFGLGFSCTCYLGVLLYETELGCNLYHFVGQNLDLKSTIYVGFDWPNGLKQKVQPMDSFFFFLSIILIKRTPTLPIL